MDTVGQRRGDGDTVVCGRSGGEAYIECLYSISLSFFSCSHTLLHGESHPGQLSDHLGVTNYVLKGELLVRFTIFKRIFISFRHCADQLSFISLTGAFRRFMLPKPNMKIKTTSITSASLLVVKSPAYTKFLIP